MLTLLVLTGHGVVSVPKRLHHFLGEGPTDYQGLEFKPLKKGNTNDILALYKLSACRLCQGHGIYLACSSMISNSDEVELGPPPRQRRMPKIFIPAQLLKESRLSRLLLGTMLL